MIANETLGSEFWGLKNILITVTGRPIITSELSKRSFTEGITKINALIITSTALLPIIITIIFYKRIFTDGVTDIKNVATLPNWSILNQEIRGPNGDEHAAVRPPDGLESAAWWRDRPHHRRDEFESRPAGTRTVKRFCRSWKRLSITTKIGVVGSVCTLPWICSENKVISS